MSLNAATIEFLLGKGLTGEDLLQVALALETDRPKSSAAMRQQRYRERQKEDEGVTCDVTGNVTQPPKENIKPPSSDPNGSGSAEPDPVKNLFDLGVSMLGEQGHSENQARSIIGSWRKGRNVGDVAAALLEARTKAISNLVEWMPKRLSAKPNGAEPADFLQHKINQRLEREAFAQSQAAGAGR
jgi:hypothetical protein